MAEPKEPRVQIMQITPQMAGNWLERNHPANRKLRPNKVRQYAADMRLNRWHLSTQVIAFDADKQVCNGQHTLHAVVESGCTVSTRSYVGRAITDQEIDEFMSIHGAAVASAHRAIPNGRYAQASIRAAVARAYILKKPDEKLKRFGEVLNSGIMGSGEAAAVLLRNYIIEFRDVSSASGSARAKLYGMAEYALTEFLAGRKPKKLEPSDEELFPVPGESRWFAGEPVSELKVAETA